MPYFLFCILSRCAIKVMIDSRVWQCVPHDILLQIAKWCKEKRIYAFIQSCRYFHENKRILWRIARECQFPDKSNLTFHIDELNYKIAVRDKFAIKLNCDNRRVDTIIYEFSDMMYDFYDNWLEYEEKALRIIEFKYKKQYLLIRNDCDGEREHNSYNTEAEAMNEIIRYCESYSGDIDEDIYSWPIVNLNEFGIYFWKHKMAMSVIGNNLIKYYRYEDKKLINTT